MKRFFLGVVCCCWAAFAPAATSIPAALVGIWAAEHAEFNGDALMKGQALYLDANGFGASVGGNGKTVIGIRLVVSSYDKKTNTLSLGMMEDNKVLGYLKATYDPVEKVILFSDQRFMRRSEHLSPEIKKSLGPPAKRK